jgi:hypothetical protein
MENPVQGYGGKQEFWKPAPASRQDFWKPAPASSPSELLSTEKECAECGTGLVADAHFCHACGASLANETTTLDVPAWFSVSALCGFLGLAPIALGCLTLGLICLIAAIMTGFIYSAGTLLDWQAVQIWRIEWLLAATAFFVAGVLLNKKK